MRACSLALLASASFALALPPEYAQSQRGASFSARTSLPLLAFAHSGRLGPQEASVRVTAETVPLAVCTASAKVAHDRLRLPALLASEGIASWKWSVPAGAPAGTWRFTVSCRLRHHSARTSTRTRVRAGRSRVRAGLMFPNSLEVPAGRLLHAANLEPNLSGSRGGAITNPGDPGYCTWGAWNLAPWLGSAVTGNAKNWYASAAANGLPTGTVPRVGAVFVDTAGLFGHVGVVTGIVNATTFSTMEMNGGSVWTDYYDGKTNEFGRYVAHQRNTGPTMFFIYKPGTQPGAWIGHIVQWNGDSKPQKTAWMIGPDGHRRWIPTIATFWCLKSHGVPGPEPLPAEILNEYPDLTGQWESCSSGGYGAGSGAAPSETAISEQPTEAPLAKTQTPLPPPPPTTWSEQETPNHPVNTFTDYHNASGMGPAIGAGVWVQVSCKVYDPTIASVNPDGYWYRIASSPWNDNYYAPANTFMNGDPYGGPYTHNTDFSVANC